MEILSASSRSSLPRRPAKLSPILPARFFPRLRQSPAMSEVSHWIAKLWPAVCARARVPVAGVRLDRHQAGAVAEAVFDQFLESFPRAPGSWETVQHWLTSRVAPLALREIAELRQSTGDWQAGRDPERFLWERNPNFPALCRRAADGSLGSREWSLVEPILWHRAVPLLKRVGVGDEDARDVFMETLAELTAARTTEGPLEQMLIFEELPRFFAVMVERRGISWLRKMSAKKRTPMHPGLTERLDAPDNAMARSLADPASLPPPTDQPWANVGFDRIHRACRTALSDFEWHLVEALFVEGSHTRLSLAEDPWVMEHLGITGRASESKRRRRLNLFVEEALSKLGARLRVCDL